MVAALVGILDREAPRFVWKRGQRCFVERIPGCAYSAKLTQAQHCNPPLPFDLGEIVTGDHDALVCTGKGESYEPLLAEPHAFLKFAYIEQESRLSNVHVETMLGYFIENVGLPRNPGDLGLKHLPANLVLADAAMLLVAVRLWAGLHIAQTEGDASLLKSEIGDEACQATLDLRSSFDVSPEDVLVPIAAQTLENLLATNLVGVRLSPRADVRQYGEALMGGALDLPEVSLQPEYSCENLLSAMWLQLYFAATNRQFIRDGCKGCGRPFGATDRRQEYCDATCRHASNQRDYYKRKKRQQGGPNT